MTCQSCGGVVGRDCFNPSECMMISQMMEADSRRKLEEIPYDIHILWQKIESLESRIVELEKQHPQP